MKAKNLWLFALTFSVITVMIGTCVYEYQNIRNMFRDEIDGFRSLLYAAAPILLFSSLCHRNKRYAFIFSVILFAISALLFTFYPASWQSFWTVPVLAFILGIFSVFIIPEARGNEFALFLIIMVTPLILPESGLLSSLIIQNLKTPFYEVYFVSTTIVGGYFYLRQITWAQMIENKLKMRGGEEEELTIIRWQSHFWAIPIVAIAIAIDAVLAVFAGTIVNHISNANNEFFAFLLVATGILAMMIFLATYAFAEKELKE